MSATIKNKPDTSHIRHSSKKQGGETDLNIKIGKSKFTEQDIENWKFSPALLEEVESAKQTLGISLI
jgi:hypothetical protein